MVVERWSWAGNLKAVLTWRGDPYKNFRNIYSLEISSAMLLSLVVKEHPFPPLGFWKQMLTLTMTLVTPGRLSS